MHVIDKLFNDFWREFSGHKNWQKRLVADYYETGYVESPTGRRHHYPLSGPQAINYPIQSVACDIVCKAMVSLSVAWMPIVPWRSRPFCSTF
jgi:DNA polymerase I-like protein with 3'-5' exonuclease and polymerase domains